MLFYGVGLRALGFLLLIAVLALPCAAVELSSDHFANVYTESEPVTINASALITVKLTDEAGKEIAVQSGNGKISFGNLTPGYYEAVAENAKLPIVVLIDHSKRVKAECRAGVDNAMSWLVPPGDFENMARILNLSGMSWVRERITWGQVESKKDVFDWAQYTASADALNKQDINVYQIFHDTPVWARKDGVAQAAPDDLREAYKWGQAFARHFKGKVKALEPWNEPDISFFHHPSSECAALQKAVYLGAKHENRSMKILGPSIAITGAFEGNLLDNDAGWYMDIWNFHIYASSEEYQNRANHFRQVMADHGISLPMWLNEAGDPFAWGTDGVLSGNSLTHQARFITRAFTQGLATGVDKFYYFVFPFYRESSVGWGVFGPGNKYPYPGLAAMSNVTYSLGLAKYVGSVQLADSASRMLVFDRGNGTSCVAAWHISDDYVPVELPFAWAKVKEARDYLGRSIASGQGTVKRNLNDGAEFFILNSDDLHVSYIKAPPAPAIVKTKKPELLEIVPRIVYPKPGEFSNKVKLHDAYLVEPGTSVDLVAEVYNFSNKRIDGEAVFSDPVNCEASAKSVKCTIKPGDIFQTHITVKPTTALGDYLISMVFQSKGKVSSKARIKFFQDPELAPAK